MGPPPLGQGGREFHWWCTEEPDAFVGTKPVYEEMKDELTEMVGAKVYGEMVSLLEERDRLRQRGVPLPHPAVRRAPRPREASASTRRLASDRRLRAIACLAPAADRTESRSVVERVVVRAGRRRHGTQDAVVLVLFGHAPRRVHVVGLSTALDAPAGRFCRRSLQASRFFEAPMASFFHEELLVTPGPRQRGPPHGQSVTGPSDRLDSVVAGGPGSPCSSSGADSAAPCARSSKPRMS